eukprot:scaffold4690_cov116-Cylindrotheca_fusiformis.AAC.1
MERKDKSLVYRPLIQHAGAASSECVWAVRPRHFSVAALPFPIVPRFSIACDQNPFRTYVSRIPESSVK